MVLQPQGSLSGDVFTFSVLLVGPPLLSAFQFTDLTIDRTTAPVTFTPSLVTVRGSQMFTITASPCSARGNVSVVLAATYDSGDGNDVAVVSAATPITIVPARAFGRSQRPWPR